MNMSKLSKEELESVMHGNHDEYMARRTPIVRAYSPIINMTYEEWVDKFSPIECDLSHGEDGFNGCLFPRTSVQVREEHTYNPSKVWTLLRTYDKVIIVPGMRGVNHRLGFFICDEPYVAFSRYEIVISTH